MSIVHIFFFFSFLLSFFPLSFYSIIPDQQPTAHRRKVPFPFSAPRVTSHTRQSGTEPPLHLGRSDWGPRQMKEGHEKMGMEQKWLVGPGGRTQRAWSPAGVDFRCWFFSPTQLGATMEIGTSEGSDLESQRGISRPSKPPARRLLSPSRRTAKRTHRGTIQGLSPAPPSASAVAKT